MKPIRMVLWFMLLHHIPGVCAPDDEEHSSDGRIRQHLLGATTDVVPDIGTRMIAALEHEAVYNADLLAWAAREAIETVQSAAAGLRVTGDKIRETAVRETRKATRSLPGERNKKQAR